MQKYESLYDIIGLESIHVLTAHVELGLEAGVVVKRKVVAEAEIVAVEVPAVPAVVEEELVLQFVLAVLHAGLYP